MKMFSADTHIIEPHDLFTRRLPAEDHYRAPLFQRLPDGRKFWSSNGMAITLSPDYFHPVDGSSEQSGAIVQPDAASFLSDLELDGVWGGLQHPNIGLHIFDIDEPGFALRCAQIYNDYVAEVYLSNRLFPQAIIPLRDVSDAVGEVERVAKMGFAGLEVQMTAPPEAPYFSKRYRPLWEAAQRLGLVISMHVGTGMKLGGQGALQNLSFVASSGTGAWPEDHPDHLAAIVARRTEIGGFGGYGDQALQTIPALVGGGVLAQFPDLHFLFVESGARWLLNVMDTMDEAWHVGPGVNEVNRTFFRPDGTKVMQFQPDELNLAWPHPLKPSEYVRRQVHATFQDDWIALRNRVHTGIEPLIWGNDYAHNEGCWPRSVEAVEIQCEKAGLTDAEREAIFGGNCARLLKAAEPVTAK